MRGKIAVGAVVALLVMLATSIGFGQTDPSVVIRNFVDRVGGTDRIAKIRAIYSFAECRGPGGSYQTEIHSATNGRTIFRQIRPNKPDYVGYANDSTFWTKRDGFEAAGANEAFVWRSHEFQWIATHLTERFRDPKLVGSEAFAGRNAVKLAATDDLGRSAHLFFAVDSKLLLGFTILDPFSKDPKSIRITFDEWKKVDGLLLPSKVTATDAQGDFVLNFNTIKVNRLDERVFEIPASLTAINEILEINRLQRRAHFERNAELLVSIFDDDFVEISNGKMARVTKESAVSRFQPYFDNSEFIEWDDIEPPIVRVSDDGSMAYLLVKKRVRLKTKSGNEETSVFAWTSTFRKKNGKWLMTSIASTEAPEK